MPTGDGSLTDFIGILSVLVLVVANGFFVAAEFSLVAVRRSRVAELVAAGRTNARALQRAKDHLDANLAATQLGITISSLALGWIGEPALARLIEPYLSGLFGSSRRLVARHRHHYRLYHHNRTSHRLGGRTQEPGAPAKRTHRPSGGPSPQRIPVHALAGDREPNGLGNCCCGSRSPSRHRRESSDLPGAEVFGCRR